MKMLEDIARQQDAPATAGGRQRYRKKLQVSSSRTIAANQRDF
jgi:hypothetical protein